MLSILFMSSLSFLHIRRHHSSLLFLINTVTGFTLAMSLISSFLLCSSRLMPWMNILISVELIRFSRWCVSGHISLPYSNASWMHTLHITTFRLVRTFLSHNTPVSSLPLSHAFSIFLSTSALHLPSWWMVVPRYLNDFVCGSSAYSSLSYFFFSTSLSYSLVPDAQLFLHSIWDPALQTSHYY